MHCGETYLLPSEAQRVVLGLQWEEHSLDDDIDVDVSCTVLTPRGNFIDTIYTQHPVFTTKGVPAVQFYEDPSMSPIYPQLRLSSSAITVPFKK